MYLFRLPHHINLVLVNFHYRQNVEINSAGQKVNNIFTWRPGSVDCRFLIDVIDFVVLIVVYDPLPTSAL